MDIREYILHEAERFRDIQSKLDQYLEAMKGILYRLMYAVADKELTPELKAEYSARISDIIDNKVDYSNESKRNEIFKNLNTQLSGYSSTNESVLVEGGNIEGIPVDKLKELAPKGFLNKITAFLNDNITTHNIAPAQVKKVVVGSVIALAVIAFGIGFTMWRKKLAKDSMFNKILDEDVHPIIKKIAVLIINKKIQSEDQIDVMVSDLRSAVYQKHFEEEI